MALASWSYKGAQLDSRLLSRGSKILGERNLPSTLLSGNFSTYGSLGDRRTLFVHYKDKKGSLSLTALTPRVGVSYLLQAGHTEILGTDGHASLGRK